MTKQAEAFEAINEFGQTSFEAAKKLGEINLKASEKLLQQQIALTNSLIEAGTRNVELLGKAKGYQEVLSGQATLAQEYGKQVLESYRTVSDILTETRESYSTLFEDSVKFASENLKKTSGKKAA